MAEGSSATEWMGTIHMRRNEGESNRFGYYIKEGVSSIFSHGLMSFASVCVIIACLLIMGSFTLVAVNVDSIISTLENENQVLAYVDESLSETEARGLQSILEGISNVSSAKFITRDEAMESFVSSYEDSSIFEGLESSVFRHRYIIHLDDISFMKDTANDIVAVSGIAKVNAHLEISEGFIKTRNVVMLVSFVLVLVLFVVSLFIMANTINLTVFERREQVAIMKMVGATSSFIRWPFMVEGLILGVFGALTAYLMQWGIYQMLLSRIMDGSGLAFISMLSFRTVAIPLLIAFLAVGFGVGVLGSSIALRKYLKI